MASADQIIYLEKFVESSAPMPAELNRILNTIRELDERSEELAAQIQDNFELVMSKTPAKSSAEEVAVLRARIEADQRLLIQWAEEKVQLATAGHEALDHQDAQLSEDVTALQQELADSGLLVEGDGYAEEGEELALPPVVEAPALGRRGGAARVQYSYEPEPLPPPPPLQQQPLPPRRTTVTLSLPRQPSGYGTESYATGSEAMEWETQPQQRRGGSTRRGPVGGQAPDSAFGAPRRRAASAAVHATAAAMAAMEDEDGFGDGGGSGVVGQLGASGELAAMQLPLEPFVPGLVESSVELQAPGRLMTHADIGPGLEGRVAELFWPQDQLWYLVKVTKVDLASSTADLYYQTGETETLSLAEAAQDGHLSLITGLPA